MTKNLAWGVGAWSLAGMLLAGAAQAQPMPDQGLIAGAGAAGSGAPGFENPAGAGGFGGTGPFGELRAVNISAGIPVGGAVLLTGAGSSTAPLVEIADQETPNTTLGGTIRRFEASQYWIWVPSQPFVEGKTYQVRLSEPNSGVFGVTDSFVVVPALALDQPVLVSEPSASSVAETNNVACCRRFFGIGVLEDSGCFPTEQRRSIMLHPGLSTPDGAVLLGQFLFRIRPGGDTTTPAQPTQWPTAVPVMFDEQADEYCFDVEAIELVSGTVHGYPDLARCAEHGQLPEVGVVDVVPGHGELDRAVCHAPPLAFEQTWCDLNEDPCATDAAEPGCGLYGYVCRDEPLPPDPLASPGGFAGSQSGIGGLGGDVDGPSSGQGSFEGSAGSGGRSGSSRMSSGGSDDGCTIAGVPARGRDAGMLAWCAAAAAALLTARRRTRAK